jgi:hypothetical protein
MTTGTGVMETYATISVFSEEVNHIKTSDLNTIPDNLAVVVIIKGSLKAIGAKKIKGDELPDEGLRGENVLVGQNLQNGDKCTIVFGDPYRVTNAEFLGIATLGGCKENWLSFQKDGTNFWLYENNCVITHIKGTAVK